ncbi:MAG: hypothetical protein DCC71_16560 [Proteobacteria bacterium]|nr:MAG: hypothetical protein DCC71_16560 [Pseudomonadota bacterium]
MGAAVALLVGAQCTPRPKVLAPANESQIGASGTPVSIDLVRAPGANAVVEARLFRAVDEAPVTSIDVTPLLARSGASLTGQLGAAELREGRNRLLVTVDADGDGAIDAQAWSTFSWEPNVDLANADRCDPLDTTHCLHPFPNDHFTVADASKPTGRRLNFAVASMPANGINRPANPAKWNVVDGFSVGPAILFQETALDLERTGAPPVTDLGRSLAPDSPTVLIEAESGERWLHWVERESYYDEPDEERPLIVRVGKNLPNATRFVMAIRNARDASGDLIEPHRLFRIYRDAIPTYDPVIEARRAHMEEIFAALAGAGVARDDLFLAWDFTTRSVESVAGKMLHMRDQAFASLGGAAPSFTVTEVVEPSDERIFRDVRGTFQVPLYLTNSNPGALLNIGPDGLPFTTGAFFTANFRCMVPWSATTQGAAPANPARPSLYGHGLLGSEGEVSAGNVRDMASEHDFVMCATRWTGMGTDDYNTALQILSDFSHFPKFSERLHQGLLNFLFLGRLMIHEDGLVSHPAFQVGGEPLIDRSELFYDGNSQGGIFGGGLAAFSQDATRFVLGVPGMNYSTLLNRSKDFDDFNIFFQGSYESGLDRQLLLSIVQILWEETETSGSATHLTSDPYPNTPPKKILMHVAYGDHQTANVTMEVAARSMGAKLRTPAVLPGKPIPDVVPWYGIDPIESFPYDGSALVIWDSGNPPPPTTNTPPRFDPEDPIWDDLLPCPLRYEGDPHECPRRQPAARLQKSEFLQTGGAVVDTCGAGQPCLAP